MAHPPRSKPPLRSSSGPPNPCITPSTETLVVVVNLMSRSPHRTTAADPFWIRVPSFRQAHYLASVLDLASRHLVGYLSPVEWEDGSQPQSMLAPRKWLAQAFARRRGGGVVTAGGPGCHDRPSGTVRRVGCGAPGRAQLLRRAWAPSARYPLGGLRAAPRRSVRGLDRGVLAAVVSGPGLDLVGPPRGLARASVTERYGHHGHLHSECP